MKRRFRYVVQISIETILPAIVRFINRSLPQPALLSNPNLRMHKYYHALYKFTANDKSNSKRKPFSGWRTGAVLSQLGWVTTQMMIYFADAYMRQKTKQSFV